MRKAAVALLALWALALPVACGSRDSLGTITVALYPGSEQEALGQLTRLVLEDRGYVVQERSYESLSTALSAVERTEADVIWAYEWDVWHQALKHDVTCGGAEELHEQVAAESVTNGVTWVSAAPCVRSGSLAIRASNLALEDVQSISALVTHVQRVNPALVLCQSDTRCEQPGGLDTMIRYYGLELPSGSIVEDSYEGCLGRVSSGTCDVTYALNTDPALADMDLRLLVDDRSFFQRSYLAVALSNATFRQRPDLERTLKELAAVLGCQTLIEVQREAMDDRTSAAQAAQRLLEDRHVIGSRRRRPTRVWE